MYATAYDAYGEIAKFQIAKRNTKVALRVSCTHGASSYHVLLWAFGDAYRRRENVRHDTFSFLRLTVTCPPWARRGERRQMMENRLRSCSFAAYGISLMTWTWSTIPKVFGDAVRKGSLKDKTGRAPSTPSRRTVFAVAFLAVIAVFGLPLVHTPVCALAEKFPAKRWFVELNGGAHRMVGRRFCNAVYRAPGGMLLSELKGDEQVEPIADALDGFSKWLARMKVPFIYVQAPSKIDMKGAMLPAPLVNHGNDRADKLMALLAGKGVHSINLCAMLTATPQDLERHFYRTDHHWNNDAVFKVFGVIAPEIARAVGDNPSVVAPYVAASSWERDVWPQCFTGSKARRTGYLFGGKDDLVVYVPRFKTEMTMDIPSKGMRHFGDFRKTIMWHSSKILDGGSGGIARDAYSLLYIGGICGVVKFENLLAPLRRRVLIVGDSYVRPLEAFLSTVVTDLIALDQRRFASGETVKGFVESFKPDIVLQLNTPEAFGMDMLSESKTHCPVLFTYGILE